MLLRDLLVVDAIDQGVILLLFVVVVGLVAVVSQEISILFS